LDFWNCLSDVASNATQIEVYSHSTLSTDLSIHVHHDSEQVANQGSSFGVQLVSELRAFGIVNHTVWIEKAHHLENSTNIVSKNDPAFRHLSHLSVRR
jgi:hypothetical protein